MNEQYMEIIQRFIQYWKLNWQTATLLATAMLAAARYRDELTAGKATAIMMAYNAAGLIYEDIYQEGQHLVGTMVKKQTEREAIDAIFNYFDEC